MLARVRQEIPADRRAGNALPSDGEEPVWLRRPATEGQVWWDQNAAMAPSPIRS